MDNFRSDLTKNKEEKKARRYSLNLSMPKVTLNSQDRVYAQLLKDKNNAFTSLDYLEEFDIIDEKPEIFSSNIIFVPNSSQNSIFETTIQKILFHE